MNEEITEPPWGAVISISTILDLYNEVMARYGGKKSLPNHGCLESCLGNAWQAEEYNQAEGMPYLFPLYLMLYLAWNHCFEDGNKRIAWACLIYILNNHALRIRATDDEAEKLLIEVVEKRAQIRDVMEWMSERLEVRQA